MFDSTIQLFSGAYVVVMSIQVVLFIVAFVFRTDKLTDLAYSISFLLVAAALPFLTASMNTVQVVIASLVVIWSLRLMSYLLYRIIKMGRDKRFDGIRENIVSFGFFWFVQGNVVFLLLLPLLIVSRPESAQIELANITLITKLIIGAGGIISLLGIIWQSIADWQKFTFKQSPDNKGRFIQSGLWSYSRHPNYFGEILVWLGLSFVSAGYMFNAGSGFESIWVYIGFIAPLTIYWILVKFSGIPPLEKAYAEKYKDNVEFQNYVKTTPRLVPKLF